MVKYSPLVLNQWRCSYDSRAQTGTKTETDSDRYTRRPIAARSAPDEVRAPHGRREIPAVHRGLAQSQMWSRIVTSHGLVSSTRPKPWFELKLGQDPSLSLSLISKRLQAIVISIKAL
ncbi:unnamed protein product [Cochlearia groenlandica]